MKGGQNRTHGSIEGRSRVDSFYRPNRLFAAEYAAEKGRPDAAIPIDDCSIQVTWLHNPYDKPGRPSRMYWLCPSCGRRARFLYFDHGALLCRECARLNYPCQQQTKNLEREERIMRNALLELGSRCLASAPMAELLETDCPAIAADYLTEREKAAIWRRFCAARDRYHHKLLAWLNVHCLQS